MFFKKCEDDSEDEYHYYYMNSNICLKKCDNLYYYNYNSKDYCVNSCDFFKDIKLYYDEEEIKDENGDIIGYNNKCVENCKTSEENNIRSFTKLNGHCGI